MQTATQLETLATVSILSSTFITQMAWFFAASFCVIIYGFFCWYIPMTCLYDTSKWKRKVLFLHIVLLGVVSLFYLASTGEFDIVAYSL